MIDIMKSFVAILLTVSISTSAFAQSSSLNLALPSTPGVYGQDSIRAGELDCKNAIGGSSQLEFGITGIIDNAQSPFGNSSGVSQKDIGVYARIIIPFDKPKERINCNTLYELEIRKKRIEVLKLQEELEALKRLNANPQGFEN
jgi:hypothetical protein|tara:strand:- start:373 stop:804 length:432 start_codon:yes stop_codon:yes gene_type:complete